MSDVVAAYEHWSDVREDQREMDFKAYAYNIAEARYVMRKVSRVLNEQAKQHGLDPLHHQALLQIFGTPDGDEIAVSSLAERLDIPPAFASRIVGQLEERGLVARTPSTRDRRVTLLSVTPEGSEMLREIDGAIHYEIAHFQRQLSPRQRIAALAIFAFYTGIAADSPLGLVLREESANLG